MHHSNDSTGVKLTLCESVYLDWQKMVSLVLKSSASAGKH